jgi:hypothetical protein
LTLFQFAQIENTKRESRFFKLILFERKLAWPKAKAHRSLGQSEAPAQEDVKTGHFWPKAIVIREPIRFEYGF